MFKLIKVIWRDAHTTTDNISLEEIKQTKLAECHTIGYLVNEDKDKIDICGFYFPTPDEYYQDGYRYTHSIPKKCIIKIINLKEKC